MMEEMMLAALSHFSFSEILCVYLVFRMERTLSELTAAIRTLTADVEEELRHEEGNRR